MSDNRREPGLYHVNLDGEWTVAEYCVYGKDEIWYIPGNASEFTESDFEEIDERPIVREVK